MANDGWQRVAGGGNLVVVAACNNETIFNANLKRSPMIVEGVAPVHVEWNAPSAAVAYNRALDATNADIIIFAHQDVFLPRGWETVLFARIAELNEKRPNWVLLGSYGVDLSGTHYGPVWSSSIGYVIGRVAAEPVEVQSFDEHLIVMRRHPGLRFDENLPGFHLYGTDIVQIARHAGLGAYVMSLPLIHNDGFKEQLGSDYLEGYRYMKRKWRRTLPLVTPVAKISWHDLHLARSRWRNMRDLGTRRAMAVPMGVDPRIYASLCGWSDITHEPELNERRKRHEPFSEE